MIKLDVQDYCHGCTEFKPTTVWDEESTPYIGVTKLKDIRIICKHYTKCHYAVSSAKPGKPIETTIISEEARFVDDYPMPGLPLGFRTLRLLRKVPLALLSGW